MSANPRAVAAAYCFRWPGASRKAHVFPRGDTRSLCGRWLYAGVEDQTISESPITRTNEDCAECVRRFNALVTKGCVQ